MEPSLNLTTLLPALRAVATINPGPEDRTWIIAINRGRFQALKITQEGLAALLRGLGLEIVAEERDRITIRVPTDEPLEEFIAGRRDELLALYQPRSLTEEEIEDLVSAIPRVFSPIAEIGEHARQEIMQRVREQLAEVKITPLGLPDLKDAIIYRFERARVEPGETVGLTVAEALSALTQAALNAFHQSGQRSNVSAGIEMLQDLLAARVERKIEQCNVHFWNKDLTFEEVLAKRAELVEVTVGGRREGNGHVQGILLDYTIDNPDNFEQYWWVTLYPQLTGRELPRTSAVVRLELNKVTMYAQNITMEDVANAIETFNTPNIVVVVPGPADSGLMFVYPDEELVIDPLKKKKIPIADNVAETFLNEIFLPTLDRIIIKGIQGIRAISPISTTTWGVVEDEIKAATPELLEEIVDMVDRVRAERSWILHLSRFVMGREGIIGEKLVTLLRSLGFEILEIQDTYVTVVAPNDQRPSEYVNAQVAQADQVINQRRKERLTAQRERRRARQTGRPLPEIPVEIVDQQTEISRASKYLYAQTQGSNLTALFARPDVDTRRTTSNNPHTILRLIGVEASRNLLISEFIYILETSGLELDPRHIILLADFMTNRGVLLPISFWGMVRSNPGPLTVGSFGKAVNVFRTAAAFGQTERVRTTASAMYLGQRGQFGSGYVDLRIDEEKVRAFEEEMARLEAEGVNGITAQDMEDAIGQLDMVTFGAEMETQEADPLAELAALTATTTITTPINPTEVGKGTISPPLELAKTVPVVSPLVQKTLDGIQVTGTLPVPETTITVGQEPAPEVTPKRRTIPKPVARGPTVRIPIRRPGAGGTTTPPKEIPKARIDKQ